MKKNEYPKTNLAENVSSRRFDELMVSKPPSEIEEDERQKSGNSEAAAKENPPAQKIDKSPQSGEHIADRPSVKTGTGKRLPPEDPDAAGKKAKRQHVMTYFSDENYDLFEEMYNEIKRRVRQETGKRLAETHVAEAAVMVAVEEFARDPEEFIKRIKERFGFVI